MSARRASVERTRERILQAMADLWLERHYDDVTLSDVAEVAGVSRQTVHRQFGSKDELLVATAEWKGPQTEAERAAEPGDVAGALTRLVDGYEVMGDANVRTLELEGRVDAMDHMLKRGRSAHRAWIEDVFDPYLPPAGDNTRDHVVMTLYAATDVMVWKLLRRDFGRSRADTEAAIRDLVDGVLWRLGAGTGRDIA
jgi:AcrR family transcriptional regulator